MRRLLLLVGAIVLVDTMFFAALTPLLPHYAHTTTTFGLAGAVWELDLARFMQGVSSAFSWTGALAWLVAAAPPGRRGQLIGTAFGAAIVGALFGPVLGIAASFTGTGWAFAGVAVLALVLAVAATATRAATPARPQPLPE